MFSLLLLSFIYAANFESIAVGEYQSQQESKDCPSGNIRWIKDKNIKILTVAEKYYFQFEPLGKKIVSDEDGYCNSEIISSIDRQSFLQTSSKSCGKEPEEVRKETLTILSEKTLLYKGAVYEGKKIIKKVNCIWKQK